MAQDLNGAQGASPTPQSGASTGSSPASTETASNASTSSRQNTSSRKIDYGMGARKETAAPSSTSTDMDDETFWKTYGDRIFKHDRFKELNSYKSKYDELAPVNQFMQSAGGLEKLQEMNRYFGPVWDAFTQMGPNANQVWAKLYPIFQGIISGQDISSYFAQPQNAQQVDDDPDPFEEKLKPLTTQINQLQETFKQREERERREQEQRVQERRQSNYREYSNMLEKKFTDKGDIPAEFKEDVAEIIVNHIWEFMPKLPNGHHLNPLDAFNEQAFNDCWEKLVVPKVRKWTGASLSQAKNETVKGGPSLPDTHANGKTASVNQLAYNRQDKVRRMAQMMQKL